MMFLYAFFAFLLGASLGSFINVVALRTVAERKWWGTERSTCDKCGRILSFYDLLPVLSYLILRGKCRSCNAPISLRHIISELLMGFIAALLVCYLGFSQSLIFSLAMLPFLLFHTLTDIESGYIYDFWCFAMVIIGLSLRLLGGSAGVIDGLLGMTLGFGIILLIIICSRGGMGFGDSVLMLGIGAFLGWKMTLLALYLGFLSGGVYITPLLLMKKVSRKDAIPMGPFLMCGALLAVFFGRYVFTYFRISLPWPWC